MILFSLGCLWQVMIKLEPLAVMIGDKVIEQGHIILFLINYIFYIYIFYICIFIDNLTKAELF